jgi:thiamine pyrophosphate-dependent acetolactate synthase large subunit-like protein
MRYNAPSLFLRRTKDKIGLPEQIEAWAGINIKPSPDYSATARACDAFAQKVEDPAELKSALQAALAEVHNGKTAVLDVRIGIP